MRDFNPRSPYGERLSTPDIVRIAYPISIHAPLTGSDDLAINSAMDAVISIHAPLTGSDHRVQPVDRLPADFNPRSPYGERPSTNVALNSANAFQSTLPLRGATCPGSWERRAAGYFNPRSPYGERRITDQTYDYVEQFQSTLPLRGATLQPPAADPQQQISIHAPLTGSDPSSASQRPPATYFNPRSPYGERPRSRASRASPTDFNPRSPYGERRILPGANLCVLYFNPRSPYGERHL